MSVTTASSDFDNAGTINLLPGTLYVEGNYTQESTGTLGIGLEGLTAGTFGQLNATGTATLAGTFNVSSVSSYQPLPGNMYQVVNFASKTGNFTYSGLQIGPTLLTPTFLPPVNPTNLTLNGVATTDLDRRDAGQPQHRQGAHRAVHRHRHLLRQLDRNLTSQVTWASATPSVATISNARAMATARGHGHVDDHRHAQRITGPTVPDGHRRGVAVDRGDTGQPEHRQGADRAVHRHRHLHRQLDRQPHQSGDLGLGDASVATISTRHQGLATAVATGTTDDHRDAQRHHQPDARSRSPPRRCVDRGDAGQPESPRGSPSSSPRPAPTPTARPSTSPAR